MDNNYLAGVHYSVLYFFVFVISFAFEAFGNIKKTKKKLYVICVFSLFFIILAFRSYEMGNDTKSYVQVFKRISSYLSPQEYIQQSEIEPGYIIFNWIISRFFENERFLFIIHAAIINFSIGRFVYKYVECPGIVCCFFVGLNQLDFFLSAMRQSLAIAILLFAFDCVISQRKILFVLLCFFATKFHNSAWTMLICLPFIGNTDKINKEKNNTFNMMIITIVIVFSLFFNKMLSILLMIFPKYNYYNNSALFDSEPRLAIILKVAVYMLLFFALKLLKRRNLKDSKFDDWGKKLSIVNLATMIIAYNATALMRMSPIFNLYATMHYSNSVNRIEDADRKLVLFLSIVLVFLYGLVVIVMKTPEWQTTYPINLEI